ncbi:hypothetical protein KW787_00290 [Candidatus Pacearchaeota archaeon]|nr:hypothetical protein [Candidatus Pacearchaeota archaeon]
MEKLNVRLIIEIMGRPADHVKETLNTLVMKMAAEKGIKLIEKIYHNPIPVKDSKDLFTAFAEVTLELESLMNYFGIIFAYLPSHIEVISPENLVLKNSELNELGHRLVQRLHDYDAITKNAVMEKEFFSQKLQELAPDLLNKLISLPPTKKPKKKAKKKS